MIPLARLENSSFFFTGSKGFCLFESGKKNISLGLLGLENSGKKTLESYFQQHAFANKVSSYRRPDKDRTVLLEGDRRLVVQNAWEMGRGMEASEYVEEINSNDAMMILMDGCRVLDERSYCAQVEAHFHFINRLNVHNKIIIPIAAFGDKCAARFPGDRKLELKYKIENRLGSCLFGFNIHDIVLADLLNEEHLAEIKKALFQ
jgi:hypothetical protein